MKKIIVIGASGNVGKAVVEELGRRHQLITAGRNSGQHQVQMEDSASVRALFARVGPFDGVVVAAGGFHFGPLQEMTPAQFRIGIDSKLMGQVNVALAAQEFLNDGGTITLTSGIDVHHPIRFAANASTANAAIEGFVRAAAVELPRGLRINAVSPTLLQESQAQFGDFFLGFETAPASRVALGYARSVDGVETGKTYRVW
jgi:NAD(P)-dependent dehydrogenase (short-subunit alcohol dehydrogenase family)